MAIFTVHMPNEAGLSAEDAAFEAVFIRDRFNWAAFLFGPLWLLAKRLWLPLLAYLVAATLFGILAVAFRLPPYALGAVDILVSLLIGCEAPDLLRLKLDRRGFSELGVVQGTRLDDAERRFFASWPKSRSDQADGTLPRGSAPPMGDTGILGFFPEPGGRA
jgi:hypothetical protein